MLIESELRGDCGRCAALCCVALSFERSELFGFDKPAGTPCRHLGLAQRCDIHGSRESRGFAGCAAYDCLGAGQRVTQELFEGRTWRQPGLERRMFEAFRAMRQVHELLLLLATARSLPLGCAQEQRRRELELLLQPAQGWSEASLQAFEAGELPGAVHVFLRSLRDVASRVRLRTTSAGSAAAHRDRDGVGHAL